MSWTRTWGSGFGSRATPRFGVDARPDASWTGSMSPVGELGQQAGRDDHGVDYVDHTVRRQDVGGNDGGAAVEGQLSVLERERDRLALEGLDGAVLLCDCDRLSAHDVAGDDVVGEHLREQRGVGEDGRVGCRRRLRELRERLVSRREDGERAGG